MKTIIRYTWDEADPSRDFLLDAIVPLLSWLDYKPISQMVSTGADTAAVHSLRALFGDDGFSEDDVKIAAALLDTLALRADEGYASRTTFDTPWLKKISTANGNARRAAAELRQLFYDRSPNLKPNT